jgi:S1-C subfamily serine protease
MSRWNSSRLLVLALLVLLTADLSSRAQSDSETATRRGYLGILVGPGAEGGEGLFVREVTPDSPAARAGLKTGDRVVKLGDEEIRDVEKFLRTLAAKKPGDRVTLGVLRDGKEQQLTVTLGDRPAREAPAREAPILPELPGLRRPAFLGVQTEDLTAERKERLKVKVDAGVVITDVVPNSPAAQAGLKRDDVITAVNDRAVKASEDLREAVQQAGAGKEVTLQVVRGEEKLSVKARLRGGRFGFFPTPGGEPLPGMDIESMIDPARRIRELERRIDELEKRVRELEKK